MIRQNLILFFTGKLVFPPVNLIETDFGAILKFENPLLAYEKLKRTLEFDDASFAFSVISNDVSTLKVSKCYYRTHCIREMGI